MPDKKPSTAIADMPAPTGIGCTVLLACPFCGATPEATNPFPPPEYTRINCFNEQCGVAPFSFGDTFEEAANKWNQRLGKQYDDGWKDAMNRVRHSCGLLPY